MPMRSPAGRPLSRRLLLAGAGALGLGLATGTPALATAPDRPRNTLARGRSFPDGLASGALRTDGATLWTRVAGGRPGEKIQLIVSENENLSRPVAVTEVGPDEGGDGTVHAEFARGRPGQEYFYAFETADATSDVGRFRTPRPADSGEPTRIGFFTCQYFTEGFYAAHRHLADEDLDVVVNLGDYIYEAGGIGPGGRVDAIGIGVLPFVGLGWLADYRNKYRLYRTDPALRAMHARHAVLPVYDDHEFRNDWWRDGVDGRREPLATFEAQKRAALRAWSENMPVPFDPADAERPTLRRSVRLGRHAELFSYDSRSFRDAQPCNDQGGTVCAEADAPGRTLLGADQKQKLLRGLTGSDATWRVLANQNMMMSMVVGDDGEKAFYDCWDGYGAERTEVLSALAASGRDLVLVTGDDHDTYAGELFDTGSALTGDRRAGVELVVPSVTSTNTGDLSGEAAARDEERNRLARNPHLKLADQVQHGYGVLTLSRTEAEFAFRRVDKNDPDAGVSTPYTLRVERGSARLERADGGRPGWS